MKFEATYYDGVHPLGRAVTLCINRQGVARVIGADILYSCAWQQIVVSPQLGATTRTLQLPNQAKCECRAHAEINALQHQFAQTGVNKYLHTFESHWRYAALATILVAGFSWAMIVFGIPALAETVARTLPVSMDEQLTEAALAVLDRHMLKASQLDEATRHRLTQEFISMVEAVDDNRQFQLLFRRGAGPNAFALPAGHIIVTDELIGIAHNDQEVLAVLAHEIGHVVHEHGLRSVLQSSAVALLFTAVSGDISAAGGFAAVMPMMLLEAGYSRKFELEADRYALDYMQANHMDTRHFVAILERISADSGREENDRFNYLATHPSTFERIQRFQGSSDSIRASLQDSSKPARPGLD